MPTRAARSGARLRTRMALGAALIALMPAVLMFLFSFQLMNRSIDRWFSPNTSELRDDSNRVVQELAEYVANNARVEAESIAGSGALDQDPAGLKNALASHRVTLAGGFVIVYGKDWHKIAGFDEPAKQTRPTWCPGSMRANRNASSSCTGIFPTLCSSPRNATICPSSWCAGMNTNLAWRKRARERSSWSLCPFRRA